MPSRTLRSALSLAVILVPAAALAQPAPPGAAEDEVYGDADTTLPAEPPAAVGDEPDEPAGTSDDDSLRLNELRDGSEDSPAFDPSSALRHREVVPPERNEAPRGHAATPPPGSPVHYDLEGIEIRGNERTASRVVLRYVKFQPGDVLDVYDRELVLTRYRLLGTGFFSKVQLSLRRGSRRGAVVLVIEVEERNTFIIQNLWMGIAADEDADGNAEPISAYLGVHAAETNLAGTGITLGAGIGLAADQLALRTEFADPSFAGTGWAARAHLLYIDARDFFGSRGVSFESPLLEQREVTDYAVVAYRRFGGALGTGHDLSVENQIGLSYRLEQIDATVPTVASHIRGDTREPIDFDILPGESVLSTLHADLTHDTRDAPLLPTRGTLASLSVAVGLPAIGSDYAYARIEADLQHWWRLPWKHVVRGELFAGGITGDAPFFEQYYVGDFTDLLPDRVLGLNPDRRQPPNFLDTSIIEVRYGEFAAKLQGEYRIPLYSGRGSIYGIDFFAATGLYGVASLEDFEHPASGYEGFAQAPLDLTYNLGLRVDTSVGGLTLAFSNLLGLLPARSGAR